MMRHNCFEAIDEVLTKKGVRLSMHEQDGIRTPRVMVEDIEAGSGASNERNMLADYCPFCGVGLERVR